MDQWFNGAASTVKDPKDTDLTTITMDFVLRYADAMAKFDELVDTNLWTVEEDGDSTLKRLCRRLQKDGLLTDKRETFNYFTLPKSDFTVQDLKGLQIDRREVRPEFVPPLDGLTAALGNFELLLFTAGAVEPGGGGQYRIEVWQTGVLVEDQYDFEGSLQPLGFWDIGDHYANNEFSFAHPLACPMLNGDFQSWRSRTNRGRDYWVYSDLKIEDLRSPAVFYCTP